MTLPTSPRNAHYILDHVQSQRRELVMLANSYHVIAADLDRVEVAASMTRFCLSLKEGLVRDGEKVPTDA